MQLSIFSIPGEILCDLSDKRVRNLWSVNSDEIFTNNDAPRFDVWLWSVEWANQNNISVAL